MGHAKEINIFYRLYLAFLFFEHHADWAQDRVLAGLSRDRNASKPPGPEDLTISRSQISSNNMMHSQCLAKVNGLATPARPEKVSSTTHACVRSLVFIILMHGKHSLSAFWKISTDEFLVTLVDEALRCCRKEFGEWPEAGRHLAPRFIPRVLRVD